MPPKNRAEIQEAFELYLSFIRDKSDLKLKEFIALLTTEPSLTDLNFNNARLGDRGAHCLAMAIEGDYVLSLANIDLSENDITEAGDLIRAIRGSKTIRSLKMSCNKIGDIGAEEFAAVLIENEVLAILDLAVNNIGPSGAKKIADSLKTNKSLLELNLILNKIGDSGVKELAEALDENKKLEKLELNKCEIGAEGSLALSNALKKNKNLLTLYLFHNNVSDVGAIGFAEALEVNNTLTSIDLRWNNIGPLGAARLATALHVNKSLSRLLLGGNEIGEDGIDAFAEVIKVNTTLSVLSLVDFPAPMPNLDPIYKALELNLTLVGTGCSRDAYDAFIIRNRKLNLIRALTGGDNQDSIDVQISNLDNSINELNNLYVKIADDASDSAMQLKNNINHFLSECLNKKIRIYQQMRLKQNESSVDAAIEEVHTLLQFPPTHPDYKQARFYAFQQLYPLYESSFVKKTDAFCQALIETCSQQKGGLLTTFADEARQRVFDALLLAALEKKFLLGDELLDVGRRESMLISVLILWNPPDPDHISYLLSYFERKFTTSIPENAEFSNVLHYVIMKFIKDKVNECVKLSESKPVSTSNATFFSLPALDLLNKLARHLDAIDKYESAQTASLWSVISPILQNERESLESLLGDEVTNLIKAYIPSISGQATVKPDLNA